MATGLSHWDRIIRGDSSRCLSKMKKTKIIQLAAVEKAIAEKYGKDAAQDIRGEWSDEKEKEYLRTNQKQSTKNKVKAQKKNTLK